MIVIGKKSLQDFHNIASNQIAFLISEDKSNGYIVAQNSAIKLNLKFFEN